MKKFEEEVKRPTTTSLRPLTYRDNILKELSNVVKANYTKNAQILREHKEYIDFLEKRLKECEDLRIEANNEAAKEYALKCEVVEERAEFKREIEKLKSQLDSQQPEIPEFVGKYIKENADPIHEMCAWSEHYGDNGTKCDDPELSKMLDWFGMNRNMFYEAVIKGYTVTKEKRFYLKNRMTGGYLMKQSIEGYMTETSFPQAKTPFTQSEIDSMETGSYEQIGVEE